MVVLVGALGRVTEEEESLLLVTKDLLAIRGLAGCGGRGVGAGAAAAAGPGAGTGVGSG